MACFQRFVYLTIIANKVQPNIVLFGIITNRCDFELKKNTTTMICVSVNPWQTFPTSLIFVNMQMMKVDISVS